MSAAILGTIQVTILMSISLTISETFFCSIFGTRSSQEVIQLSSHCASLGTESFFSFLFENLPSENLHLQSVMTVLHQISLVVSNSKDFRKFTLSKNLFELS